MDRLLPPAGWSTKTAARQNRSSGHGSKYREFYVIPRCDRDRYQQETFHLVGFGADGKIAFRKKIKQLALTDTFKKIRPCIIGMEACLSAHFVGRTLRVLGHAPRIIPAIYVKPFVKGQKYD
jgi:hypothetical protein